MSMFKNVHIKFWQNDFVLGLTAEERYFYIYLITNSMTNQCGIYKFNRRLAELETGYSCDKIESFLKKFEEYGKVIISCSTTEIMLVNWFKHNFKSNKKALANINKELKDVKDKELLEKLYDFCCKRQYPINEMFSGVILPEGIVEKSNTVVKEADEVASGIQEEIKIGVQDSESKGFVMDFNQSQTPQESTEDQALLINNLLIGESDRAEDEMDEGEQAGEEVMMEECQEEEPDDILEGTTIAFWGFTEDSAPIAEGECCISEDISVRNTA